MTTTDVKHHNRHQWSQQTSNTTTDVKDQNRRERNRRQTPQNAKHYNRSQLLQQTSNTTTELTTPEVKHHNIYQLLQQKSNGTTEVSHHNRRQTPKHISITTTDAKHYTTTKIQTSLQNFISTRSQVLKETPNTTDIEGHSKCEGSVMMTVTTAALHTAWALKLAVLCCPAMGPHSNGLHP